MSNPSNNNANKRDRPAVEHRTPLLAVVIALTLTGCAAGPDYVRPETPLVAEYSEKPLPAQTASTNASEGTEQSLLQGAEIPAEWWTLFESTALERLIQDALDSNPDLQAAEATLREAQASAAAGKAAYLPRVDASAGVNRSEFSAATFGQPGLPNTLFTLYEAKVGVTYDVDLFGRSSREMEVLRAQVEHEQFRRDAAYLTLIANVVTTAVQEASLREQITAATALQTIEQKRLDMLQKNYRLGAVARTDIREQEARLADAAALLPPLANDHARLRHQLAVLLGRTPSELQIDEVSLASFRLPDEVALGVPSELVDRRPDIRMSEAMLQVASAKLGVATTNLLPSLTITGSYGSLTDEASELFSAESMIWNIGGELLQPIFRGGELRNRKKAAVAGFDEAAALYRSTVLQAFRDVADALQALQSGAELVTVRAAAAQVAAERLQLAMNERDLGASSELDILDAEREQRHAELLLIPAQAARIADTASLFHALGVGSGTTGRTELSRETR